MPASLAPSKARPIKLRAGCTIEQGFAQIMLNCLRQVRANEAGLLAHRDPEFLHQMRVGLRRLRCASGLFKPWITLPPGCAEQLAWLGKRLGAARDAEVLAGTTLPALSRDCADVEDLGGLHKAAAAFARRRRRAAVAAVKSARYLSLMAGLEQWLKSRGWRSDSPCPSALDTALDRAAKQLLKRRGKKAGERLSALQGQASGERRHELRIAVKKLRYASEFFCSIAAPRVGARLGRLSALQELLGQLNDAEVGSGLLAELGQAQAGPSDFVRGVLWAQSQRRLERLAALLRVLGA